METRRTNQWVSANQGKIEATRKSSLDARVVRTTPAREWKIGPNFCAGFWFSRKSTHVFGTIFQLVSGHNRCKAPSRSRFQPSSGAPSPFTLLVASSKYRHMTERLTTARGSKRLEPAPSLTAEA